MFLVNVVWISVVLAAFVICTSHHKREIGRDTYHYSFGPAVKPEDAHLYAYQIAFRVDCAQNCGGTIISDRHIITAAHCIADLDPKLITIKAGALDLYGQNGQIRNVFSAKIHRMFDSVSLTHDIALLTLQERLNLTGLTVAKLPKQNENFEGAEIEISGWGNTKNINLTYAYYKVRNNTEQWDCQDPSKLCADRRFPDMYSYEGDSGGPAVLRKGKDVILVGAVSGFSQDREQDFYSNIAFFRSWIDEAMTEGDQVNYLADKLLPELPKNNCRF